MTCNFCFADENLPDPGALSVGDALVAFVMLVALVVLIFIPWVNRWERRQRAERKDRWKDRLRDAEAAAKRNSRSSNESE